MSLTGRFKGFEKDILVYDFESTGFETDLKTGDIITPGDPIQLGAVRLDKSSLEEKDHYLSLIKTEMPISPEAFKIHGIKASDLKTAPARSDVASQFIKQFEPDSLFLSSWNSFYDRTWLDITLTSINRQAAMYDYHILDIWVAAYVYLCQLGHPEIVRSEPTFNAFGQSDRSHHDALDDSRRTAEILRAVVFKQPLSLD